MSSLNLLDDTDLEWVSDVVDVVANAAGQPWRVALERLDDAGRADQPRTPTRFTSVVTAIQRLLGGRARNAGIARTTRSLVLGKPALTADERGERIAHAAQELEVTHAAVETLLWSDIPRERPVELPRGRPSEVDVAATANVHLLQRAMMRAQTVTLRIWGDAGLLVHTAAARGLLTTLSRGDRGETVLDIIGPLGLFHRTGVYGRALAGLIPLLAGCERFEVAVLSRGHDHFYTVDVASPVLLPAVPERMALPDHDLLRLMKELARIARDIVVTPRPAPIVAGASLVCPDAVLERSGRKTHVELIGFWTVEYLVAKRELYRQAHIDDVVFCIDDARACTEDPLPPDLAVVRYTKHMTAAARQLAEHI